MGTITRHLLVTLLLVAIAYTCTFPSFQVFDAVAGECFKKSLFVKLLILHFGLFFCLIFNLINFSLIILGVYEY